MLLIDVVVPTCEFGRMTVCHSDFRKKYILGVKQKRGRRVILSNSQ